MEVVSTSKLASSENKKTITASNFRTMAINSFCYATWFDEMPNRKLCRSYLYFHDGRTAKKCPNKHLHKTAKSIPTSNILKEKNCFTLWKCIIFAILVKTWLGGGVRNTFRSLLIDTMDCRHKISKAFNIVWH